MPLFPDLGSAGRQLATKLEAYRGHTGVVVLTPVLGGVPVALEVAKRLGVPLDFIIIRRLFAPRGYGSQVCAVSVAGTLVVDEELPARPSSPESALDYFVADALDGLTQRERVCRGVRPPTELAGKTVLLVDCGIGTGLTMRAATGALRTRRPARIVVAAPVAAPESRAAVEAVADEVVCLAWPHSFGNTAMWYGDFKRPADEQLRELLETALYPDAD